MWLTTYLLKLRRTPLRARRRSRPSCGTNEQASTETAPEDTAEGPGTEEGDTEDIEDIATPLRPSGQSSRLTTTPSIPSVLPRVRSRSPSLEVSDYPSIELVLLTLLRCQSVQQLASEWSPLTS
jgi:hypothetical protein